MDVLNTAALVYLVQNTTEFMLASKAGVSAPDLSVRIGRTQDDAICVAARMTPADEWARIKYRELPMTEPNHAIMPDGTTHTFPPQVDDHRIARDLMALLLPKAEQRCGRRGA